MADLFAADWGILDGDALAITCLATGPTKSPTATPLPTATAALTATPSPTTGLTLTPSPTAPPLASPTIPATRDDLTKIRGIGSTYAGRLYGAGVTTFGALAQLNSAAIKAIVAPGRVGNFLNVDPWIEQAAALAQAPKKEKVIPA